MGLTIDIFYSIILFIISYTFIRYIFQRPTYRLPPGPKGWPIIGCLPLLGTMPHVSLTNLAKKFGPIMHLKMGTCDMVVVSDPDDARIFLKTMEHNFSNHPPNAGATHIAYGGQDFVFADIGTRWNLFRKLSNLHMLGAKSYKDWCLTRENEVISHMVKDMYEMSLKGEIIDVPSVVLCTMANIIGQKSLSRRVFETHGLESNDFKYMIVELMRLAGLSDIGDFIPSIAWMDLQGNIGKMKHFHQKFDKLLTKMIEEHKLGIREWEKSQNFIDVVMPNREVSNGDEITMTNVKALLSNLFIAGTDTSVGTIEWALTEMLKYPKIMNQAHEEMDRVVGKSRQLKESDLPNLPYLKAICKETFWLHPTVPLSLPRLCAESCKVINFYIPKRARFLVNVWAIGQDPNVWTNLMEFNPERFLAGEKEKVEPWGNNFELIPFGGGRRMCAEIRMGILAVEYILGTLVHVFEWNVPEGSGLDIDEVFGLVLQKAVLLSAMAVPRLHLEAYMKI